jgi:ATP synthase F1 epsilon subunit
MSTIQCSIVSAEKEIFSEAVTMVVATGSMGELGITPGHSQLLTGIKPGPVKVVKENGEEEIFFLSGTAVISKDACRRPHVIQMLSDQVKFPVVRRLPLVPKKEQKLFRAKRPTTYAQ